MGGGGGGGGAQNKDSGGDSIDKAPSLLPVFDELSRWKVTRGSVSRMVRLAGEVRKTEYGRHSMLNRSKCL